MQMDAYESLGRYIRERVTLSDMELGTVLSRFKLTDTQKNAFLLSQGQTGRCSYFVAEGSLRIFFLDESGREATRYVALENRFATALVSFITGKPSDEFIQVLEPGKVLYITRDDFYGLFETVPAWEKFYRNYLETAYVNNTGRLMSFLTMDASEKYRQLWAENPELLQRMSNKSVASYLNISQETLSRLKSKTEL